MRFAEYTVTVATFLFLSIPSQACLFSASREEWTPEPWPQGTFELHAGSGTTTVAAYLDIGRDGTMTFSSDAGTCGERTPLQVEQDRTRNQRTFSCSGASFVIRPRGATVQGEALIPENVSIRGERFCATYGENGQCVHYEYRDRTVSRIQRHTLRVTRTGQKPRADT